VEQPLAGAYDADITVEASFGSMVTVSGTHNVTGRTFTCTGRVSFDWSTQETWTCTACASDGTTCETCDIEESYVCAL